MNRALVAVVLCACGDDRPQIQVFEPTNGRRLMIEQYQFDDGTRLVQPTAFYDRIVHARCTPQTWIDGVDLCVPDAEEAFYREDTCETLIGRESAMKFPTYFIAQDTRDLPETPFMDRWPARLFAAGEKIDPIETYYLREGENEAHEPICTGPFTFPEPNITTQFWELGPETLGAGLVPISETEIGDGRLGLVVRQSTDGALVPTGFRDRELDVACVPVPRGNGGVCEPIGVNDAMYFADNECTQPAILVGLGASAPTVASTLASTGCREYHAVDPNPISRVYTDTGTGCTSVPTSLPVFPLGPTVDLTAITRTRDDAPKRRIQRILASEGDLHVYGDRMFDSGTRAECQIQMIGETLRCLPTALAPIVRLFQPGCTVERRFAEVPAVSCEPFAFAANYTGTTIEVHAIGDPFDGTAYTIGPFANCTPYTPGAGAKLHEVGPILPDDTFVGAVSFGAR